jgi:hypothetical protein
MANVAVGFQLTANAAGMAQGINAGVVELQKLGLAAKQTAGDVRVLTGLQLGTAFVSAVRSVAQSFASFTAGASTSIDATNKLSRSLGISFTELQRIQLAADLSGASSETLANAFTRAQLTIAKAAGGGREATASLRALGLSVDELAGLSASQQFEAIATAIAGIDNPARRAAAAVSIFGESGAKLLPTFQELASNLQRAEGFFAGFRSQLTGDDAARVEAINDAFTEVQAAVTQTAAVILAKLEPALTAGARSVTQFLQGLDVSAVAASAEGAISGLARAAESVGSAFTIAYNVLAPLASAVLPPMAEALGLISGNLNGAAIGAGLAAGAMGIYVIATTGAAAATAALSGAISALLSRTGIGVLVLAFGALAGAAIAYGSRGGEASQQVAAEMRKTAETVNANQRAFNQAAVAAQDFGAKVKAAVKIPDLSLGDIAQDSINSAQSAIAGLAKELGGTANLPRELVAQFNSIQQLAERANGDLVNQRLLLDQLTEGSRRLSDAVQVVTEKRQADVRAAKEAAEAARKAAEEDRKTVAELSKLGVSEGQASQLQLAQDLLAIANERANAERALSAARQENDNKAIAAAQERLRLVGLAVKAASEQDKQRQLQALGIDNKLLQPADTIAREFLKVKEAFRAGLIDPQEAKNALKNLSAEGIKIRKELNRELSRPSQKALEVQDVRTSGGFSELVRLANGREDPAIEQNRQQLVELTRIRQGLERAGVRPALIVGT